MFPFFRSSNETRQPPSMPPDFTPTKGQGKKLGAAAPTTPQTLAGGPTTFAVDPGAIFPCVNQFVYIWPTRGPGFWAYITFVGRRSIAGFRFQGRRFRYFGMDLRRIDEFYCA